MADPKPQEGESANPWGQEEPVTVSGAAGTIVGAATGAVTATSGAISGAIARTPFKWVLYGLRFLNIANAICLGMSAFQSWFITDGSVTRIFLAIYQMLFGALLLLFELRVGPVARWIKKQFGFMFTYVGRLVFLVLISAVTFGMIHTRPSDASPTWDYSNGWVLGVGIATLVNAVINAFVLCSHPHFKTDPQGRITDDEIAKYLKEHPEVAAQARSGSGASGPASTTTPAAGATPSAYVPPAATKAPAPAPSKFYGSASSADAGLDVGDIDPFSESADVSATYTPPSVAPPKPAATRPASTPAPAATRPASTPAPAPAPAPASNPFVEEDNPFA